MTGAERKQSVLDKQLADNRELWRTLQASGVSTDTELRLDFFFDAADEASARALATLLHEETDYDVGVASGDPRPRKRQQSWAVLGTTQATTVSPELLDEWVGWMVDAGFEHGCVFDGWGAQAPLA